ncbi:MAG TPA: substrate-binding domain-containing protein [Candidatus Binataceae bacterium]|nr:substrate-binding domain-containing protein [Candidatus Binataceae bacterium]
MASHEGPAVRRARVARGLTQDELARRAGLSRQALGAIESGVYQPGVGVALALARELGDSVEALFGAPAEPAHLEADWMGAPDAPGGEAKRAAAPGRVAVALARVGGRLIALAQPPPAMRLAAGAGVLEHATGRRARVAAFRSREEIDATLLVAGCDPAVSILADWMGRHRPATTLAPITRSSSAALAALLEGRVHAAGVHLCDRGGGEDNLAAVRETLKRRPAVMVNFARWELGLGVRRGNPLGLRSIADLARPGVRMVNREAGSGARLVLDQALAAVKIPPRRIAGYARELSGHLEVAAAIAAGEAAAGLTLRVAAEAWGLSFVPVREERYDLVILQGETDSPPVRAMLDALNSGSFASEVSQLCAYDTARMGQVVARLNS